MEMSRGWVTGWLIAGLLVVSPGRTLGQSTGKSSERAGGEAPAFLEQYEWKVYDLSRERKGFADDYPPLYRTRGSDGVDGELLAIYARTLKRYDGEANVWLDAIARQKKDYGTVLSSAFFESSDGKVWLETSKGLLAYGPSGATRVKREDMEQEERASLLSIVFFPLHLIEALLKAVFGAEGMRVTCICETDDGGLWFGTEKKGLLHHIPVREGEGRWEGFKGSKSGLPSNHVTALAAGPDGRIWVGTKKGLVVFANGKHLRIPRVEEEFDTHIRFLHCTPEGQLWVGTGRAKDALCVVKPGDKSENLTWDARGTREEVQCLYDLPLGTRSGELWLRRKLLKPFVLEGRKVKAFELLRVVEPHGSRRFQVHSRQGVEGDSGDGIVGGLADYWVNALAEDDKGRLWVALEGGISVFDPEGRRWHTVLPAGEDSPIGGQPPKSNSMRSVVVGADGSVWFGGENAIVGLVSKKVGPR